MTQYVTQQNFYDRNPELIGNDIELIDGLDIEVNRGDIKLITNVESIYKAISRRLYTAKSDFERLFKTTDGLIIVDEDYGNDAFNYLSSLNSDLNRDYVLNEITRIFSDEPRIKLESIDFVNSSFSSIEIEVKYIIISNSRLETLII